MITKMLSKKLKKTISLSTVLFIFLITFTFASEKVFAAYNETKGESYGTIQEAIDSASSFDKIILSEKTYEENLFIDKSITIEGAGSEKTTIEGVLNDSNIIRIQGEENDLITVEISGVTLDHKSMESTTEFGSVYGISAVYTDGLNIEDVRAVNLGGDIQYERGGIGIYDSINAIVKNVEVDNVRGSFAAGFRVHRCDNVYMDDINVSNLYNASGLNMWMMYIHTVENSEFTNIRGENFMGPGNSSPRPLDITTSKNNIFDNIEIHNVVSETGSTVAVRMEYSEGNSFSNMLIDGMTGGMIVGGLDITLGSEETGLLRNNTFENITIRNLEGEVQTRGVNLDRGANNNTFKDIYIEDLKGYKTGLTQFSVMGIQLNTRDPNPDNFNNLFEGVWISGIDTTGEFYGVVQNSTATNALVRDNNFKNINIALDENDNYERSYGYYDNSDGGNVLENSTFNGFNETIYMEVPELTTIINVKNLNSEKVFTNITAEELEKIYDENYFDFVGYRPALDVGYGSLKKTFNTDFFDLGDTHKAVSLDDIISRIRNNDKKAKVVIPGGTEVAKTESEEFDVEGLIGKIKLKEYVIGEKLTNFSLKFGHDVSELIFNNPIDVHFYIKDSEGKKFDVYRSTDEENWTTDGLLDTGCIVQEGLCSFQTEKASYFIAVGDPAEEPEEPTEEPPPATGGGLPPWWWDETEEVEEEPIEEDLEKEVETSFVDVEEHWARNYILLVEAKCGVEGYEERVGSLKRIFSPDSYITRAELIKILIGCLVEEDLSEDKDNPFKDVVKGEWYTKYVLYAAHVGWAHGYEDGNFRPNQYIDRVEAVKIIFLSKYEEHEISGENNEKEQTKFKDTETDQWYSHYLRFMADKGIIEGYSDEEGNLTGYFGPANNLTRAEAAKIIANALGL